MYHYEKSKDYRLWPKLTDEHIYPNSFQKMKVKYASQVLSHRASVALNWFADSKILPVASKITASFSDKMNRLFDILNSSQLDNSHIFKGSEKQINFLNEMSDLFENLKAADETGKEVSFFLDGQLLSKGFWSYGKC
nr:unnamed protein product [Callosobruchus chinensis]